MEFIYTPQQMMGYKGYASKVKVGNWSEDVELETARLKDFLARKDRGELKCTKAEARFARALAGVDLRGRGDGLVHFGDSVMLMNQTTNGCIAVDMEEQLAGIETSFAATTTWYTEPCARNTFEVVPYTGRGDAKDALWEHEDDALHYGQKFMLRCHGSLSDEGDVRLLQSKPKTPLCFARYSREHEVSVACKASWNSVWECVYLDPQYRMEMEGQPVSAGHAIAIIHCGTHQYLASDRVTYRNDFGAEYELFGKTYADIQKKQLGSRDQAMLAEQNRWCFINQSVVEGEQAGSAPEQAS